MGFFDKLKKGLQKTSSGLTDNIKHIFKSGRIDDEALEELEETLIRADIGTASALELTETLRTHKFDDITDEDIRAFMADTITEKLHGLDTPLTLPADKKPAVILMVGVNGSGKTTTIGKLAVQYKAEGKKVHLGAGDTFRAGAVEQLAIWAERAGVTITKPAKEGADPAGTIFQAYEEAERNGSDILIADTAGRLQNRKDLMEQLAKILRVLQKKDPSAPHACLLVLDATVGQNAHSQVEAFKDMANVTGLVLTKLDSSAKGGVIVALAEKFHLPVHYIGIGEKVEDLRPFESAAFARALMGLEN